VSVCCLCLVSLFFVCGVCVCVFDLFVCVLCVLVCLCGFGVCAGFMVVFCVCV